VNLRTPAPRPIHPTVELTHVTAEHIACATHPLRPNAARGPQRPGRRYETDACKMSCRPTISATDTVTM
jgi:hypothetical protein